MTKQRVPEPLAPDLLERVRDRFRDFPLVRDWHLSINELRPGQSSLSLDPSERTINGSSGVVNGGVLATLADMACALALATHFDGRMPFATADLHIRFLEPAKGPVILEALLLRASARSAILECQCRCEGRLVALCTTQFAIKSRRCIS